MKTILINDDPVPIRFVEIPDGTQNCLCPFDDMKFLERIGELHGDKTYFLRLLYRGTSIDRLGCILETGIDVEPTTSTLFVGNFEKAWEYGGIPKIVIGLDYRHLVPTFKEVPASISKDELVKLKEHYPTVCESKDGKTLWLTRLPEGDPRIASDYEVAYARWISSNPWDALKVVFIFAEFSLLKEVIKKISVKDNY